MWLLRFVRVLTFALGCVLVNKGHVALEKVINEALFRSNKVWFLSLNPRSELLGILRPKLSLPLHGFYVYHVSEGSFIC